MKRHQSKRSVTEFTAPLEALLNHSPARGISCLASTHGISSLAPARGISCLAPTRVFPISHPHVYFLPRIHMRYFLSRIHMWYFLSRIHMWHFLPRIHTRRTSSHISTQDDLLYIKLSLSAQCIGPRRLFLLWCCTDISSGAMTRQYCSAGRSDRHPRQRRGQLTQYNVPSSLTGCNQVGVSPGRGDSGATAEWAASCGAPV